VALGSASLTITNTNDNPDANPLTHLNSYSFSMPVVQAGDAWAWRSIGIAINSLSDFSNGSGFWDLDNVQLAQVPEPMSAGLLAAGVMGLILRRRRR
jgi:hypothetical protein